MSRSRWPDLQLDFLPIVGKTESYRVFASARNTCHVNLRASMNGIFRQWENIRKKIKRSGKFFIFWQKITDSENYPMTIAMSDSFNLIFKLQSVRHLLFVQLKFISRKQVMIESIIYEKNISRFVI